ncbi:hypothetical protein Bca101_013842 [Brassica carinata]
MQAPSYDFCGEYDTPLREDDIKKELINHFNSSDAFDLNNFYTVYPTLKTWLDPPLVGAVFKLDISRVATVRSNRPLGNGQIGHGYTVPARMIEFAAEIDNKVIAFRKQRRFI